MRVETALAPGGRLALTVCWETGTGDSCSAMFRWRRLDGLDRWAVFSALLGRPWSVFRDLGQALIAASVPWDVRAAVPGLLPADLARELLLLQVMES